MLPDRTEILIVGAGPTGLALAIALRQAGIDHLLIDERPRGEGTSRAAVVHAHTLEALASIGVADTLLGRGISLSRFVVRDRDRPLLAIGFEGLPSEYKSLLMVPQSTTEAVFAERLAALGGRIVRSTRALAAEPKGPGARVRLQTPAGESIVDARYVVGGDGMHSLVRTAAGIGFAGEAYGQSFVLADVRMRWPLGAGEVSLFFSAAGLAVVAPLPGGSFRIVATVDEAPEAPSGAFIQQLLDARGPTGGRCRVDEIVWSSRFRVHHRLADTYRKGPFLLMGDAAHVHSPAGGQGMNTGIVDAVLLGRALAQVVGEGGPDSILDDYAATRRPAAAQVLALAGRLTGMATLRSAPLRLLRNLLLRIVNRIPAFKSRLALDLSGISRRQFATLPTDSEQSMPAGEPGSSAEPPLPIAA
ncbi:MAG TPA: FAD-dependent monooxygenase [Allosphingosinicella sp.]|nr:FAD-dependent monooxygenase [Allosphingosinicella sp.]